jgi:F-type H+-transporting ATPase subunit b
MELNATVFLQLALFLFLLAWLSTVLFAPLLRVYDEREKRIEGAAEEARQLRAGANEKAGIVERRLAEAGTDARRILDELRKQGADKELQLVDEARRKAASRLEDAQADLFAATDEIKGALRAEAQAISDDIVKKVLGRAA